MLCFREDNPPDELVFFVKQKTAYEMRTGLEFRRVLFRSPYAGHAGMVPGGHACLPPFNASSFIPRSPYACCVAFVSDCCMISTSRITRFTGSAKPTAVLCNL